MSNHETCIKDALKLLANEWTIPPPGLHLEIQVAFLDGSPYRVAIVGKYQVAKA